MTVEPPFIDVTSSPTKAEVPRGRLEKTSWDGLREWNADDTSDALTAFEQGCAVLRTRPEWQDVCTRASALVTNKFSKVAATTFFRENFQPFRVYNADDSASGTVTGYYEPLLRGSRTRTKVFKYPIYAQPQDLVTVELADVYADLKFRRLRGRLVDNKLVPYYDRAEIESTKAPLKGLELVLGRQSGGVVLLADPRFRPSSTTRRVAHPARLRGSKRTIRSAHWAVC